MKRLRYIVAVLIAFFVVSPAAFAQRPKVAVVLSGGGAKGAAHVGVLKVLEEYDIPIDIVTGTSMGALVGGLYAVGHTPAEMDSILTCQDWDYVITGVARRDDITFEQKADAAKYLIQIPFGLDWNASLQREQTPAPTEGAENGNEPKKTVGDWLRMAPEGAANGILPMGLMAGQKIYSLLSDCTVGYHEESDFSKLPIPYACVAVDLVSGKEVVFDKGILPMALRASMAIPGVFPPVKTGDMVLVDGGLKNNYPVDVARAMGADIVIGVKTPSDGRNANLDDVTDMISKVISVTMTTKTDAALADTDILIQPSVDGYGTMSFDNESLRHLIDNGEKAARDSLPQLLALKKWLDEKEKENAESFVGPMPAPHKALKATKLSDTIVLSDIKFVGIKDKDEKVLMRKFNLETGKEISIADIERAVDDLYATKAYNSVVYSLEGNKSPFGLTMTMVPNRNHRLGLGLRFDTEEISSILVDVGFNYNSLYGHRLGLTARLANYYQFGVNYSYLGPSYAGFGASYRLRHSAMPLLSSDRRKYDLIDYLQNDFTMSISTGHLRDIQIDLGANAKIYYYRTSLNHPQVPDGYSTDEDRKAFVGPFLKLDMDSFDNVCFPTRGFQFDADFSYLVDFTEPDINKPFMDASLSVKWAQSIGKRFTFIPFLHTRALIGDNAPVAMMNCVGGTQAGRYTDHQIPFYGTVGVVAAEPFVAVVGMDMRFKIYKSHYLLLAGNYGRNGESLQDFFNESAIYGVRAGYAFDLVTGPLELNLNWNSIYKDVGFYASLGFWF